MDDRGALTSFVCQQNIERYERLLKTELTDLERAFVERRLAEEKQALHSNLPSTVIVFAVLSQTVEFLFSGFNSVAHAGLI